MSRKQLSWRDLEGLLLWVIGQANDRFRREGGRIPNGELVWDAIRKCRFWAEHSANGLRLSAQDREWLRHLRLVALLEGPEGLAAELERQTTAMTGTRAGIWNDLSRKERSSAAPTIPAGTRVR